MLIDKINSTNFKRIFILGDYYNEREESIKQDIITKLQSSHPSDSKIRNYIEYLKEEKNIDIFISKDRDNPDAIKVQGVKNYSNFFDIGEYHSFNFKPEDVATARKKQVKEAVSNVFKLLGLAVITASLILSGKYIQKRGVNKEIPVKVIQTKNSIVDSLKITELGKELLK